MKKIVAVMAAAMLILTALGAVQASPSAAGDPLIINNDGFPTRVRTFLAGLSLTEGEEARVIGPDHEVLDGSDLVATGQTLEIYGTQSGPERQDIVVIGDVTGSGVAGIDQVVRLATALSGCSPLEGLFALAGDLNGSGGLDVSDLVMACEELEAVDSADLHEVTSMTRPWYFISPDQKLDVELHYVDGVDEVPYIGLRTAAGLYNEVLHADGDAAASVTLTEDEGAFVLTRETGTSCILDPLDNTILFDNYSLFFKRTYASTVLDIVEEHGVDESGAVHYISRPDGSYERQGSGILIDLDDYDLDMIMQDGTLLVPLQTFSDVLLSNKSCQALYNGEAVFLVPGSIAGMEDLYYSVAPKERSQELADFTYNSLCLVLDLQYGLKPQHDISTFDELFRSTGLDVRLRSTDPAEADDAVYELIMGYLADLHSRFGRPSPYAGRDAEISSENVSPSMSSIMSMYNRFGAARAEQYPDGAPSYEEVGNTAYVTFDAFVYPDEETDYYATPPAADAEDTVGIIMYAHSQIMREDSPIENVVVDLSNNSGGEADAAVFVLGWLLGDNAMVHVNDAITGAQASIRYRSDVNADGRIDENDTVASKKLYCLISPCSFSCGNLVPAVLKGSRVVTMMGQNSAGGACVVRNLSAADGTIFRISGPFRISTMANGSYYDVDRGVEPDVWITDISHYYEREYLTEYMNGMLR